jgi:hypothetical protein
MRGQATGKPEALIRNRFRGYFQKILNRVDYGRDQGKAQHFLQGLPMITFQLVGMALLAMFFGALVSNDRRELSRD